MPNYDCPIKQKSREAIAEFIRANVKKPLSQCRVFTLLGAQTDETVALELESLWLPLGVKPENITTVERDAAAHARLVKDAAVRGYHISPQTQKVEDYFEEQAERAEGAPAPFDIIYLDYMGHQTGKEMRTLRNISGKLLLDHQGIFIQNHAAKREHKDITRFYKIMHHCMDKESGMRPAQAELENTPLSQLRDEVTKVCFDILWSGTLSLKRSALVANFSKLAEIKDQLRTARTLINITKPEVIEENYNEVEWGIRKGYLHPLTTSDVVESETSHVSMMEPQLIRKLKEQLGLRGITISDELADVITSANLQREGNGYCPRLQGHWSYNSDSNMMMNVDAFALEGLRNTQKEIFQLVEWNPQTEAFRIYFTKKNELLRGVNKAADKVRAGLHIPERIYLGNAWVPPARKQADSSEMTPVEAIEVIPSEPQGMALPMGQNTEAASSEPLEVWKEQVRAGKKLSELLTEKPTMGEAAKRTLAATQAWVTIRAKQSTVAGLA